MFLRSRCETLYFPCVFAISLQNWLTKINQFDDMGSFTPGENYNTFEINNSSSQLKLNSQIRNSKFEIRSLNSEFKIYIQN